MNSFSGDEPHVSMVRPFLDHRRPLKPAHADDDTVSLTGVRAYAMTGGRAHATVHLEFETMLQATAAGRQSLTAMMFERADIIHMAGPNRCPSPNCPPASRSPSGWCGWWLPTCCRRASWKR